MKSLIPKCLLEYFESEAEDNADLFAFVLGSQEDGTFFARELHFPPMEYSKSLQYSGKYFSNHLNEKRFNDILTTLGIGERSAHSGHGIIEEKGDPKMWIQSFGTQSSGNALHTQLLLEELYPDIVGCQMNGNTATKKYQFFKLTSFGKNQVKSCNSTISFLNFLQYGGVPGREYL